MRRVYLAVAAFVCSVPLLLAQQREGIIFLHLRLADNRITAVKQSRSPGTLKERRGNDRARAIRVDLLSPTGDPLWNTTVADPRFRRLEYEDPDHPGQIKVREVVLTNAEFVVRVPAHPRGHEVVFARGADPTRKTAGVELGRVIIDNAAPDAP